MSDMNLDILFEKKMGIVLVFLYLTLNYYGVI